MTTYETVEQNGDPLWWVLLVTGSLWLVFALIVFQFDYTTVSALSILVGVVCVAAGLLDPARTRPAATYPHDLFYGRSLNLFVDKHLDINAAWYPPARWTSQP